jgi:hypothetical protein
MDLKKMLEQQQKRGLKNLKPLAETPSVEIYSSDENAPRPYNIDSTITPSKEAVTAFPEKNKPTKTASIHKIDAVNKNKPLQQQTTKAIKTEQPPIEKKIIINTQKQTEIEDTNPKIRDTNQDTKKLNPVDNIVIRDTVNKTKETQTKTQTKTQKSSFYRAKGNAKKILLTLYTLQKITDGFISKDHLSEASNVKKTSIKTTLYRLSAAGMLTIEDSTKGRNSAFIIALTTQVSYEIEHYLRASIRDTNRDTNAPSSSSSNIKTTNLPDGWNKIDYSHLQNILKKHGEHFGLQQLKSIYKTTQESVSVANIQKSIDHFTYGLENFPDSGLYKRKVRVATLLETLKNGEVFNEPRYISEELIAQNELGKKLSYRRKQIEKDCFENHFNEFQKVLTLDEIETLVPNHIKENDVMWEYTIKNNKEDVRRALALEWVREYFRNMKWPAILDKLASMQEQHKDVECI